MGIFSWIKRQHESIKRFKVQITIPAIVGPHEREWFSLPRIAEYSGEWKNKIKSDFNNKIFAVVWAENPLLALRSQIVACAAFYADYQVLAMTAEERAASFYSSCPYVSDELQHHLDACIEHHDKLREYWWNIKEWATREGTSLQEAIFHYATTHALVGLYYVNGLNLIRAVYEDVPVGRDWFRPLILSSLIRAEDNYRTKIGLPSLLTDGDSAFYHSSLGALVSRGDRNPLFEWESIVGRPHPYQGEAFGFLIKKQSDG
jgi:hypothetical protein